MLPVKIQLPGQFNTPAEPVLFFPVTGKETNPKTGRHLCTQRINHSRLLIQTNGQGRGKQRKSQFVCLPGGCQQPQPETDMAPATSFRLRLQSGYRTQKNFMVILTTEQWDIEKCGNLRHRLAPALILLWGENIRIVNETGNLIPLSQPFNHHRSTGTTANVQQQLGLHRTPVWDTSFNALSSLTS